MKLTCLSQERLKDRKSKYMFDKTIEKQKHKETVSPFKSNKLIS